MEPAKEKINLESRCIDVALIICKHGRYTRTVLWTMHRGRHLWQRL
jgi:hypothetical protein